MPDSLKFSEQEKARALYEARNPESLSRDILNEWDTNQKPNARLAQLRIAHESLDLTWRGPYTILSGLFSKVVTYNGNVDGWRIVKAIEAEGMQVARQQEEAKKKGLLGGIGL